MAVWISKRSRNGPLPKPPSTPSNTGRLCRRRAKAKKAEATEEEKGCSQGSGKPNKQFPVWNPKNLRSN